MPTMADMPDGAGPADDPAETDAASSAGHDDLSPIGDEARRALEAVIMVADQPIEASILAQLVERSPQQVEDVVAYLVTLKE